MFLHLVAVALASVAMPRTACALPITEPLLFDFEDGLQGWELFGAAQREQTQALGGQWAIFGEGTSPFGPGGGIGRDFDLMGAARMTMDVFNTTDDIPVDFAPIFAFAIADSDLVEGGKLLFTLGLRAPVQPFDPMTLARWSFDLPPLHITHITITWGETPFNIQCFPDCSSIPRTNLSLFIDNITIHPVPEPRILALAVIGLLGIATIRVREGFRGR